MNPTPAIPPTDLPPRLSRRKPASAVHATSGETPVGAVPARVPKLKSFRHIRNPKVRRAKEYEQYLLFLRDLFPEYTMGLDEQIAYARSQQERNSTSDRDRVYESLRGWGEGSTCGEVAEDLKIPYATAYKILREFLDTGLVIATERAGISGNKPYLVYKLAH